MPTTVIMIVRMMVMVMRVVVRVVVRMRLEGGAFAALKRNMRRLSRSASNQLDSMVQHTPNEQSLHVLLDSLDAPRQCEDERIMDGASDRPRQGGECGVFEGCIEDEVDKTRSLTFKKGSYGLVIAINISLAAYEKSVGEKDDTSGVLSLTPNPVPPVVNIKSTPFPGVDHSKTTFRMASSSSGTMPWNLTS